MAEEIALTHQDKWDGTGYGRALSGSDIPLSGRIVAIADVLDALGTERPYKRAWSFSDACDEIHAQSGRHFDPDPIFAFQEGLKEIEHVCLEKNLKQMSA